MQAPDPNALDASTPDDAATPDDDEDDDDEDDDSDEDYVDGDDISLIDAWIDLIGTFIFLPIRGPDLVP